MAQDEKKRQSFIQPKKNKKNVSVSYKYSGAAILSGIQLDSTYEKIQQTVVKPQAPWWVVESLTATHVVPIDTRPEEIQRHAPFVWAG